MRLVPQKESQNKKSKPLARERCWCNWKWV